MRFTIELEIETKGKINPEELKYEIKNRLNDFTMYNEDDEEVEIEIVNPWEKIKITEQ